MTVPDFYDAFDKEPDPPPPDPDNVTPLDPARSSRYAATALTSEVERVATATEGTRNHTLNAAAYNLGQLAAAGHLDHDQVAAALTDAARQAGLDAGETRKTVASGLHAGGQTPRVVPDHGPDGLPRVTVLDDEDTFWTQRPMLEHVRTFARARRTSPWAVLGVVLTRVLTAVPPHVVLPPLVGGHASLNLFVGLVGKPGAGKGAAEAAAGGCLDVGHVETVGVGSGEGIGHMFARRTKDGVDMHTPAVLFTVAEIDTLAALGGRQGATLLPELRKAWSGERLGFSYADPTKRLPIEGHSYRLSIVAGIQPGRGGALLDDSDAGTPQRFLWLPATDPDAPDTPPEPPDRRAWHMPLWPRADARTGRVVLPVCDTARALVDAQRLARLRGEGEALDGHALLARLKLAAALALLDERATVTDDDWTLAGQLADVSDATRQGVRDALVESAGERNRQRATAEAERQAVVGDTVVKRACKTLLRKLRRDGGPVGRSDLRKALASTDRGNFEAAVERLVDAGQVTLLEDDRGPVAEGQRYTLAEGVE